MAANVAVAQDLPVTSSRAAGHGKAATAEQLQSQADFSIN
jgi:hypothetical protein